MTGKTSAGRRGSADDPTEAAAERRGLRRFFRRPDRDRSSRRAGADPFPAVLVTPRVWVALG